MKKTKRVKSPNKPIIRVDIHTSYLTDNYGATLSTEEFKKQVKYERLEQENLRDTSVFTTPHFEVRVVKSKEDCARENSTGLVPHLAIVGSTREKEALTEKLTNIMPGLIIARYSVFYGGPSKYTGTLPQYTGYSLEIPKRVETVRTLLTNEGFLKALLTRDIYQMREAISAINKVLEEPILETPRLEYILGGLSHTEFLRQDPMMKKLIDTQLEEILRKGAKIFEE